MRAKVLYKRGAALWLLLATGALLAQDSADEAFLLYLSDYQQVDGEWVDPAEFAQQLEQMSQIGKKDQDSGNTSAEVKNEKRS